MELRKDRIKRRRGLIPNKPIATLDSFKHDIFFYSSLVDNTIIQAWPKTTNTKITWDTSWFIRTEVLFFFLILIDRYAFAIGGANFRDNLQDAIVSQSISTTIKTSFAPTRRTPKGQALEDWYEERESKVLEDYNKAKLDYQSYEERYPAKEPPEDKLMVTLSTRIALRDQLQGKLDKAFKFPDILGPKFTMYNNAVILNAIAKAQLQKQVEDIYHNHPELH